MFLTNISANTIPVSLMAYGADDTVDVDYYIRAGDLVPEAVILSFDRGVNIVTLVPHSKCGYVFDKVTSYDTFFYNVDDHGDPESGINLKVKYYCYIYVYFLTIKTSQTVSL